ncbi:MAG: Gfo/Idh/MocA family oxidoreductase [Akkermansiaceae bacterium]|jgi:predicted dehydrogenase|nr:Gfo/Idh/MocA family oxidoreductase [Akkermansiaceae bacterium]MDP4647797.1 Gfo/Idh/MocA family oxidoreductase [Akkermansiaceae bacterium]MDP4719625.1 Gfo/Idh/MocA family oxidoreductase [Akkermansiaceae bacterium]MDP4780872.1 Gfo/Idh/MocA family oxidoreductase [Akkermansiaceae bacterium]MDP4896842.1 Gfo/Idh/MocA family oxidoreductase [Akkermansiaceae bacterium]
MKIAILGCGSRGRTYAKIASSLPDRYEITAAADLVSERTAIVAGLADEEKIAIFGSAEELFAAGKLADVLIIGTQDAHHFGHAMTALSLGYDLLLEKPAAESLERCEELDATARSLGRRIVPGFVLRYTPFYSAVKAVVDSGRLGRIMTLRATEGVEPFHQAHSYVRGHWSKTTESSPMIVAKCSHDTDLLCWLSDSVLQNVSSVGRRDWFRSENAPPGAPPRCSDGCPAASDCLYDAHRYLTDKRPWLRMVMDSAEEADDARVTDFIKTSPWGRCVYHCDNDTVDHQEVAVEMENGITATLTMTAFDCGRTIEIHGTLGSLRGGSQFQNAGTPELWFRDHRSGEIESIPVVEPDASGYAGHGGGDFGLINALDGLLEGPQALAPGLDGLAGHRLAFIAEKSRLNKTNIKA